MKSLLRVSFLKIAGAVLGLGMLAFVAAVPQADAKPSLLDKLKEKTHYATVDLAVIEFQGVLEGAEYVLGGAVKNNGLADYTRVRSIRGPIKGRRLQLFAIQNGGLTPGGSSKLLKTYAVPSIKAGQTWQVPTIRIPTRDVPGSITAQFLLKLTDGDGDSSNDWKQTWVSPVR